MTYGGRFQYGGDTATTAQLMGGGSVTFVARADGTSETITTRGCYSPREIPSWRNNEVIKNDR